MFPRGVLPSACNSAATSRHVGRLYRRNEPREYCTFRVMTCQLGDHGNYAVHPWGRPRPFRREEPLHIDAKMQRSRNHGIRVEVVCQRISFGLSSKTPGELATLCKFIRVEECLDELSH